LDRTSTGAPIPPKSTFPFACFFASLLAFVTPDPALAQDARTWTDSTGKYKIEAAFVEVKDGAVRLRRPDGRVVKLPLAKLSPADRRYVKEQLAARDPRDPNNPFEMGVEDADSEPGRLGPGARGRGQGRDRGGLKVGERVQVRKGTSWEAGTIANLDGGVNHGNFIGVRMDGSDDVDTVIAEPFFVRRLRGPDPGKPGGRLAEFKTDQSVSLGDMTQVRRVVSAGDPGAKLAPDPAPALPAGWRPRPLGLGPKRGFFEDTVAIDFASLESGKCIVVSTGGSKPGDTPSRVELCDVKTGRAGDGVSAPKNVKLAALSPSGQRLLTVSENDDHEFGPVQAWNLGPEKLDHIVSWQPNVDSGNTKLTALAWLDDERLLTLSETALTLWNLDGAQAVYQIELDQPQSIAFSPGRKQLAVARRGVVDVYSAADGDHLARVKLDDAGGSGQVAFSPSGRVLAVAGNQYVHIFDLAEGKPITSIFAPMASAFAKDLSWVSDEHVLVGGSNLLHVPSQMLVWNYEHDADQVRQFGGRAWYFFDDRAHERRALIPFDLPHRAATAVNDADLVLKPGDKVSLDLEIMVDLANAADTNSQSAADALKVALEKAGYVVADDAPNRLVARTAAGETKEVDYRSFGFRGESQKVSVTTRVYELELIAGGQVVWSRRAVQSPPMHIMIRDKESIDDAVQREMQPNMGYFGSAVPSRVLKPELVQQRTSRISISGLE
jgi:hypothetical protein